MLEPSPSEALLLTPIEAARRIRVSVRQLQRVSAPRGPLRVVRIGRLLRYEPEALAEYVAGQRVTVDG